MSLEASLSTNKFFNFTGQIGDLAHDEIRVVESNCTIEKASKYLMRPEIDYLIIQENNIPVGMVSKSELLARGMSGLTDLTLAIKEIMNSDLVSVQRTDTVLDSLMFMVKHKLDYLLVMDQQKAYGIITQKDWLSVKINYPIPLIKKLESATTIGQVVTLRQEAKQLVWDNFIQEGRAISLTNIVTVINDAITKRIIQLSLDQMQKNGRGIPPVSFAWIGMGSEGRKAQTIRTDQDNGLIFENVPNSEYDKVKSWFIEFAGLVSKALDECGYPLCEGNIMATNTELCNSTERWAILFQKIISNSDPKELLEASIYFDFRCIYGNQNLANRLWDDLFKLIDENSFFMREFAQNMLEASRPPVKKMAWRISPHFGIKPPPFDIKRQASAPLDAAMRLLALHHGIRATHSLERLSLILEKGYMSKSLADEVKIAFDFILRLRFRNEFNMKDDKDVDHMISTKDLIPLQLRNLKTYLNTIYELQDYAYKHVTEQDVPWSMR